MLHKNPARVQSFDLSFGKAHVFHRQKTSRSRWRMLEVDPVGLVHGRSGPLDVGAYRFTMRLDGMPWWAASVARYPGGPTVPAIGRLVNR